MGTNMVSAVPVTTISNAIVEMDWSHLHRGLLELQFESGFHIESTVSVQPRQTLCDPVSNAPANKWVVSEGEEWQTELDYRQKCYRLIFFDETRKIVIEIECTNWWTNHAYYPALRALDQCCDLTRRCPHSYPEQPGLGRRGIGITWHLVWDIAPGRLSCVRKFGSNGRTSKQRE